MSVENATVNDRSGEPSPEPSPARDEVVQSDDLVKHILELGGMHVLDDPWIARVSACVQVVG